MNQTSRLAGVALAAAAATLFIAGCQSTGSDPGAERRQRCGEGEVLRRQRCKGQAECKTAMNSCKGQNSCKGHGFTSMTEQACVDRLGRA